MEDPRRLGLAGDRRVLISARRGSKLNHGPFEIPLAESFQALSFNVLIPAGFVWTAPASQASKAAPGSSAF